MTAYTAYTLTKDSRIALLRALPPAFATVKADHITHIYNAAGSADMPAPARIRITHYICDPAGLDVLKVTVDGKDTKPDGTPYHITWSMDKTVPVGPAMAAHLDLKTPRSYESRDSNDLIDLAFRFPERAKWGGIKVVPLDILLPSEATRPCFIGRDKRRVFRFAP